MTITMPPGRDGRRDPAALAGHEDHPPRMGFFTDTSVCIGCKACEVACKEWNLIPQDGLNFLGTSYDNTGELGANSWRHVAFIEQSRPVEVPGETGFDLAGSAAAAWEQGGGATLTGDAGGAPPARDGMRWLMSSDVCKHCTDAACLDVCPTGSLVRTELGTVVVQEDICNGCGYCVPACPFGVLDQRKPDGRVWKCTLCYDRTRNGLEPACAQACPTDSIQYGPLDELHERADARLARLHEQGAGEARLYGRDEGDGVGGFGAFFLLLDDPEVYRFPPDPVVTTRDLKGMWLAAAKAGAALAAVAVAAVLGGRR